MSLVVQVLICNGSTNCMLVVIIFSVPMTGQLEKEYETAIRKGISRKSRKFGRWKFLVATPTVSIEFKIELWWLMRFLEMCVNSVTRSRSCSSYRPYWLLDEIRTKWNDYKSKLTTTTTRKALSKWQKGLCKLKELNYFVILHICVTEYDLEEWKSKLN